MEQVRADGFDEFVAARWSALLHVARLLTGGDRQRAEDLVQEALVKLWFAWPKVAEQAPEAYVRTVLVRMAARSAKRRWWGERPVEQLPDRADPGDVSSTVAERSRLEAALALLTPKQRAAVVLRLRPPAVLVVYTVLSYLMVMTTQQYYGNVSRYLLPLFPLFVPLALALRRLGWPSLVAVLGTAALASGSYAGYVLFELGVP
jgi:RNA polymerase sigma factor (sigma-70 family)